MLRKARFEQSSPLFCCCWCSAVFPRSICTQMDHIQKCFKFKFVEHILVYNAIIFAGRADNSIHRGTKYVETKSTFKILWLETSTQDIALCNILLCSENLAHIRYANYTYAFDLDTLVFSQIMRIRQKVELQWFFLLKIVVCHLHKQCIVYFVVVVFLDF